MTAVDIDTTAIKSSPLTGIVSSYAVLPVLASWLSTLDLYHLALTNRSNFAAILGSPEIFKLFRRRCLCDGRGLIKRQEFQHPYNLPPDNYLRDNCRKIQADEPVEVRLYNVKCDEGGALPCVRCGINVCEECRYYPREPLHHPERRPHLNIFFEISNIMCLCRSCDDKVEKDVSGKFLNELCDCDVFERWICTKCKDEEGQLSKQYLRQHTIVEGDFGWDDLFFQLSPTKAIHDRRHNTDRLFWCMCGAKIDDDARPRCTLCKRHHLPEEMWAEEWREVGHKMPWIDEDPHYPHWVTDRRGNYPNPYPELGPNRFG
ncbi:hypothetical protein B0J13DRAFT_546775 [Dactylonectria estremocensis]|uniref:Uncharacterized protein n=1 Tax=Dactylonectria estremocensis TaxID=1079267 RepID=A0A9P9J5F2_9HYPO|nr:hypothetical protein B0J13DRAFT_546775 [Dactylonectria estremocensis]